jgi:hypothetical protein
MLILCHLFNEFHCAADHPAFTGEVQILKHLFCSRDNAQCFVYGMRTVLILVDFDGKSNVDC